MENTQLARNIDLIQNLINSVNDIDQQMHDPKGVFAELEKIGLRSNFLKRDITSLAVHLKLYLKIARQTLDLWVKAKNISQEIEDRKNEN